MVYNTVIAYDYFFFFTYGCIHLTLKSFSFWVLMVMADLWVYVFVYACINMRNYIRVPLGKCITTISYNVSEFTRKLSRLYVF